MSFVIYIKLFKCVEDDAAGVVTRSRPICIVLWCPVDYWGDLVLLWAAGALCSDAIASKAHDCNDTEARHGPGGLSAWIRLTWEWHMPHVDLGLNMDS